MRQQGINLKKTQGKKPQKPFPKEAKKRRVQEAGTSYLKPSSKIKNYCKIEIERIKPCGSSMVKACFYLFIYLLAAGGLCYCLNSYFFVSQS